MRPARFRRTRGPTSAAGPTRDLATQLFGRNPQHVLALLRAAWPAAVGPEVARRTEVIGLEGRTLRVRVPDAGWRKVLHRMRREILARMYHTVGGLAPTAIGLQEGHIADGPPKPPSPPPAPARPLEVPPGIDDAAAAITDPELRAQFTACAALYLRRSRA